MIPVMVWVSEAMVLAALCACVDGTVSSDTNWTVLAAPAAALLSWQPLCLCPTKASRLLNCCLQMPQMWMSGVSSTSTVVPPGTVETGAELVGRERPWGNRSTRHTHTPLRDSPCGPGAAGPPRRDGHGAAGADRPPAAPGTFPRRSQCPAGGSRLAQRPQPLSTELARVPPPLPACGVTQIPGFPPPARFPGSAPACFLRYSGFGACPGPSSAPLTAARAPERAYPAGAQRHLHCTEPGKPGAASPPPLPGFMAAASPAGRLCRPHGTFYRRGTSARACRPLSGADVEEPSMLSGSGEAAAALTRPHPPPAERSAAAVAIP